MTYRINFDKEKQKNVLIKHMDIPLINNVAELGLADNMNSKFFTKFSDYNENTILFMYFTSSEIEPKLTVNLFNEQDEVQEPSPPIFFHFARTIINKKDTSTKVLVR